MEYLRSQIDISNLFISPALHMPQGALCLLLAPQLVAGDFLSGWGDVLSWYVFQYPYLCLSMGKQKYKF